MSGKVSQHRSYSIDFLTVLSCFAVVGLHCNDFWSRPHGITWVFANLIESALYFGAPMFFMISGATLLDYWRRYDTKTFFMRRIWRVFLPFLFWSVIAMLSAKGLCVGVEDIVRFPLDMFRARHMQIYWFFGDLFMLYLLLPVLSPLVQFISRLRYAICVGIALGILAFALKVCGQRMLVWGGGGIT